MSSELIIVGSQQFYIWEPEAKVFLDQDQIGHWHQAMQAVPLFIGNRAVRQGDDQHQNQRVKRPFTQ